MAVLAVAATVLLAACGEKDEPESNSAATEVAREDVTTGQGDGIHTAGADRERFVGQSGTATKTACELVSTSAVEGLVADAAGKRIPLDRTANDSLDLSFCEFRELRGPDVYVKLTLDTAVRAVRRYYNLIVEARQLPSIGTGGEELSRPELVRGVGDDGTYGGAGAFWIPAQLDLTSIKDERIVKVHFFVPDVPRDVAREAAAELAAQAFAGYSK